MTFLDWLVDLLHQHQIKFFLGCAAVVVALTLFCGI